MNIEALNELDSFTGTAQYYKTGLFPNVVYTDGARHLFQNGDCYWLHDKIAALQMLPVIKQDRDLQNIQFWTLKVDLDTHKAILFCERDTDDVVYTEHITFTDFPLPEIRLYVGPTMMSNGRNHVIYLPSEY